MGHWRKEQIFSLPFGSNELKSFRVNTNEPLAALIGTNPYVRLDIAPVTVGSNLVLGVTVQPDLETGARGQAGRSPIEIVNLSPAGSFIVATKVAFYGGVVVAAPFLFFFLVPFFFPAPL